MLRMLEESDGVVLRVAESIRRSVDRRRQFVLPGVPRLSDGWKRDARPELLLAGIWVQKKWIEVLRDAFGPGYEEVLVLADGRQGHADFIVGDAVWEIKSVNRFAWMKVKISPPDVHVEQIRFYMKASGLSKGYILYENRETCEWVIWEVRDDERQEDQGVYRDA